MVLRKYLIIFLKIVLEKSKRSKANRLASSK